MFIYFIMLPIKIVTKTLTNNLNLMPVKYLLIKEQI